MNVAVILAGGKGTRLMSDMPKQFLKVSGKRIIEYSVDTFEANDNIDEIAIVAGRDYMSLVKQIVADNQYKKVKKVLMGGDERYLSSVAAVNAYDDDEINMLFHDAVRPLVTDRIIADCLSALAGFNAVNVAVKATDTIIEVENNMIKNVPDRNRMYCVQTPQCFKRGIIKKAYELALKDPDFHATDDCGTVINYLPEEKVYVVRGEPSNFKVTYKEDIDILEKLLQNFYME